MERFTIKVQNAFGKYAVCDWEAETAEQAVEEFKKLNPAYKNKGLIIAEKEDTMKFYFQDEQGNRRELSPEELREHMSEYQIREASEAKLLDPLEEVSYMTVGGFIIIDF